MLEYFVVQIHYMRIAQIELSNEVADLETGLMAEQGAMAKWMISRLLTDYLNCIGNFRDSIQNGC